jgi:hypothetical protein
VVVSRHGDNRYLWKLFPKLDDDFQPFLMGREKVGDNQVCWSSAIQVQPLAAGRGEHEFMARRLEQLY